MYYYKITLNESARSYLGYLALKEAVLQEKQNKYNRDTHKHSKTWADVTLISFQQTGH